jgi:hypothetical protein
MAAFHRLSFQLALLSGGATAITPCIDGTTLSDLASAYEIARGYDDPAGGYGGLVPDYMRYGPMDDYFLGRGTSPCRQEDGTQYMLGCQCGEVGCWPLIGQIVELPGAYEWRNFYNPCRTARDYRGLGPFRFGASAYVQAVSQMTKELTESRAG